MSETLLSIDLDDHTVDETQNNNAEKKLADCLAVKSDSEADEHSSEEKCEKKRYRAPVKKQEST